MTMLSVLPPVVARQRLGKDVTAAKNTHTAIEDLFDASFSMRCVSYEKKYAFNSSQKLLLMLLYSEY
jgi:hypothetical protein